MCAAPGTQRERATGDRDSSSREWGLLVATGLGLFLVFLDAMIANLALPDIQARFGGGESAMQWVVVAYSVGMALAIMPSGTLADRQGRRKVFTASVIVFAVASAGSGMAPALWFLVGCRFVQGMAAAAISVTSLAIVSASFTDQDRRARAIGTWSGIAATGLALGPTLGGVLTEAVSWRAVFLVGVPVAVAVVVLAGRFVEESLGEPQAGYDPGGQVLFLLAVVGLSFGVVAGPHRGWTSPPVLGAVVVAVLAGVAFVRWELGRDEPMMDVRLFRDGTYSWAIGSIFVTFFTLYGSLLLVSQFWQDVRDFSPVDAGLLMLPGALVMMFLSPRVGRWVAEKGPFLLARIGLVILFVSIVVLGVVVHFDLAASAAFALMAVGTAFIAPSLTALSMSRVPDDRAGMASGIFSAQRAIGSTIGYAVMGSILAAWLAATLGSNLSPVLPDAAERNAVKTSIIDNANPYAYAAEIGPGEPIPSASSAEKEAILDAAKDEFLNGIQVSLVVAGVLVGIAALASIRFARPPRDADA